MKIKQFNILTLFAISLAFVFQACEEEDKTFTGESIFAFEQTLYPNVVINQLEPVFEIPVMLVGPHSTEPLTANFEIVPFIITESGDTSYTNIEEGVHFEAIDKSIQIEPNSSYGYIPLNMNFDALERGEDYTIIFELTGGDLEVSEIGNNIVEFDFTPHRYFVPEDFDGVFMASEVSNQPNAEREYELTLEYDSSFIDVGTRLFYYSVSGFWGIDAADSTSGAWDRQKINILVDDSDPEVSVISTTSAGDVQEFFKRGEFDEPTQIFWARRENAFGSFNTWTNDEFRFPAFDLQRADGTVFPPVSVAFTGQNVRVELNLEQ